MQSYRAVLREGTTVCRRSSLLVYVSGFHSSSAHAAKPLPARRKIEEGDIEESFLKGTGPGGQAINKTNSAVQITHLPTGIVVKSQATRSRSQNRKVARQILAEKLDSLEHGDQSRTALKSAIKIKKKASKDKKARRKYRKLAENATVGESQSEEDESAEDGAEEAEKSERNAELPSKSVDEA